MTEIYLSITKCFLLGEHCQWRDDSFLSIPFIINFLLGEHYFIAPLLLSIPFIIEVEQL